MDIGSFLFCCSALFSVSLFSFFPSSARNSNNPDWFTVFLSPSGSPWVQFYYPIEDFPMCALLNSVSGDDVCGEFGFFCLPATFRISASYRDSSRGFFLFLFLFPYVLEFFLQCLLSSLSFSSSYPFGSDHSFATSPVSLLDPRTLFFLYLMFK